MTTETVWLSRIVAMPARGKTGEMIIRRLSMSPFDSRSSEPLALWCATRPTLGGTSSPVGRPAPGSGEIAELRVLDEAGAIWLSSVHSRTRKGG